MQNYLSSPPKIQLIVGLGNPGLEYQDTRHNVGFWWVEELLAQYNLPLNPAMFKEEKRFRGALASLKNLSGIKLLKPLTFMNLSGVSVATFMHFYRIVPEQILVVHDELDLPVGTIRLKLGGGHAGHNGLKSIIEHLGSNEFMRLRIGIGRPTFKNQDIADYVLHPPQAAEKILMNDMIQKTLALKVLSFILQKDLARAQKLLHSLPDEAKS